MNYSYAQNYTCNYTCMCIRKIHVSGMASRILLCTIWIKFLSTQDKFHNNLIPDFSYVKHNSEVLSVAL